jgi:AcrR family transcriptional regulator
MKKKAAAKAPKRRNDPIATRENILEVAMEVFVGSGLSGARVSEIARKTRTSQRMIYYYFGDKVGLYRATLERAYAGIRQIESVLELDNLGPAAAMRKLVETTLDYEERHPEFVRIVGIENLHQAKHMTDVSSLRKQNNAVVTMVDEILQRGRAQGVFRKDVEALEIHMVISALCFFRISNRYTFKAIFGLDMADPRINAQHKKIIGDAVIGMLSPP